MVHLTDFFQYGYSKYFLLSFCKQFKDLPNNDLELLKRGIEFVEKDPQLHSYMFQFLSDSAYNKKHFSNQDILTCFQDRFLISDPYGLNKGTSDMSTVNTAFTVNHLIENGYFKELPITVYSTPLVFQTPLYYQRQNSYEVKPLVDLSKQTTNNTNCDLKIGHRLYDIKHSGHMSTNKNHINPLTYEQAEARIPDYLNNVFRELKSKPKSDIRDSLKDKLELILKDKHSTWVDKNHKWNQLLQEQWPHIDPQFTVPMAIPITEVPFEPRIVNLRSKMAQELHIPADMMDNQVVARRMIARVCNIYGGRYLHNAELMTDGAINPELLKESYTVD